MANTTSMRNGEITDRELIRTGAGKYKGLCPVCDQPHYLDPESRNVARGRAQKTCHRCRSKIAWLPAGLYDRPERVSVRVRLVELGPMWHPAGEEGSPAPAPAAIDPEAVARIARETAEKVLAERSPETPVTLQINVPEQKPIIIEASSREGRRHPKYNRVMAKLMACRKVYLVGPAGTGKSTLPEHIAEDLDLPFGMISCTEGLSETQLLGRRKVEIIGAGESEAGASAYVPSDLINILESGGVFLFDEIDSMDANTALVLNALLSGFKLSLPNRPENPIVRMHERCYLVAAANTYGTGTDVEYVGRNQLDSAFLDRFVGLTEFIGYDEELERGFAATYGIEVLVPAIHKIRANVAEAKIRRTVSTRAFIQLGQIYAGAPDLFPISELLNEFFAGWKETEKAKALDGVDLWAIEHGARESAETATATEPVRASGGAVPSCPECGADMKRRTAGRGRNRGKQFWGCTKFPRCHGTREME